MKRRRWIVAATAWIVGASSRQLVPQFLERRGRSSNPKTKTLWKSTRKRPRPQWSTWEMHPTTAAGYVNHTSDDTLDMLRHISRYERQYRIENGLDLENWHPESSRHRRLSAETNDGNRNNAPHKGGQFDNYQAVPLSQGYGTHYVNLWIGSPTVQRKTLIVDTGSHYTAFPCAGCEGCGAPHHTDPYFDPSISRTFHALQCDECRDGAICQNGKCPFQQAYTEGSTWSAIQVKDQVYCGGSDYLDAADPVDRKYAIPFMFGCQTRMSGLFVTQLADGIIGMSAHPATLPKHLYDRGKIEHNLFALCFRRELGTSKRGVPAGTMTIGGVSTQLDSGPVVYARNIARAGWYTVYVKNIYIRAGGGSSTISPAGKTVRIRVDTRALNSGKGVIVDSGTTDTYLNQHVAREFGKAWRKVTGLPYSNSPISLTDDQLYRLPTVLIQCQAASPVQDPSIEDYSSIPGYTGSLDPTSPHDPLIAVPATSYMDYSPITRRYMSRLYFTESAGSVLGSNTLQGHNVVFDWENHRVGFAESSCTYDKKNIPKAALDEGYASDCTLSEPLVTQACYKSVQTVLCQHNPKNIALLGTEKWTSIVESPGTIRGLPCANVAKDTSDKDPRETTVINCNGNGVCEEERPCQLTCAQLSQAANVSAHPEWQQARYKCGDSFWSACDYGCKQTRIKSVAFTDGHCHELSREERQCHIGACARSDPCLVPFVLHTVTGLREVDLSKWTDAASDIFEKSLLSALRVHYNETYLAGGDIHIISALPWYEVDDLSTDQTKLQQSGPLGVRIVAEISVVASQKNDCLPASLHGLAKMALEMKKTFLDPQFPLLLVNAIKDEAASLLDSPFVGHFQKPMPPNDIDVMTFAWTVRTEVDDEINYFGPQKPFMATMYAIVHNITVVSSGLLMALLLWTSLRISFEQLESCSFLNRVRLRRYYRHAASEETVPSDDDEAEEQVLRGSTPSDGFIQPQLGRLKLGLGVSRLRRKPRATK